MLSCLPFFIQFKACEIFDFYFLSAGGTVSEEKQKDAGHFDPLYHSHCSNYYSFWNKVLIMHSSGFCFLCGCFVVHMCGLGLGVLVLLKNKADCLSYPPGNKERKNSTSLCRCTLGYVEMFCGWFLMKENINDLFEPWLFYQWLKSPRLCDRGL